jgi:hypothetical protein
MVGSALVHKCTRALVTSSAEPRTPTLQRRGRSLPHDGERGGRGLNLRTESRGASAASYVGCVLARRAYRRARAGAPHGQTQPKRGRARASRVTLTSLLASGRPCNRTSRGWWASRRRPLHRRSVAGRSPRCNKGYDAAFSRRCCRFGDWYLGHCCHSLRHEEQLIFKLVHSCDRRTERFGQCRAVSLAFLDGTGCGFGRTRRARACQEQVPP